MSDIFDQTGLSEYDVKKNPEVNEKLRAQDFIQIPDTQGLEMPRHVYELGQQLIAESPDDPDTTVARLNSSYFLSRQLGIPIEEAYNNFEAMTEEYYGKATPPQETWEAIGNSYKAATIGTKIADIGYQLWLARGESEDLYKQIQELETQMPPEDTVKRYLPTKALKWAAQFLPSQIESFRAGATQGAETALIATAITAAPVTLTGVGSLSLPVIATMAFGVGSAMGSADRARQIETGALYYDLLRYKDPVSGAKINPKVAWGFSAAYGGLAAVVEMLEADEFFKRLPGVKQAAMEALSSTENMASRSGIVQRQLINYLADAKKVAAQRGSKVAVETLQETFQEGLAITAEEFAKQVTAKMDQTSMTPATAMEITKRLTETLVGSALGMGALNIIPTMGNLFLSGAKTAKVIGDNAALQGKEDQASGTALSQDELELFNRRMQEPLPEDSQIQVSEVAPGEVYTLKIGSKSPDPETGKAKRMGWLRYEVDRDEMSVKILGYEKGASPNVNAALTKALMQRFPGWNINAEAKSPYIAAMHQILTQENPRGPEAGLQWYKTPAPQDKKITYEYMRERLREAKPGWKADDVEFSIRFLDTWAKAMGTTGEKLADGIFAPGIIGERGAAIAAQGAYGAITEQWIDGKFRSMIQLTKDANPSTWMHEATHAAVFFALENRDKDPAVAKFLAELEGILGVQDGDWNGIAQGWAEGYSGAKMHHEALAYAVEDYFLTGKVPDPKMKSLFHKIAKWLTDLYRSLKAARYNISPELESYFDRLFASPESPLYELATTKSEEEVRPADTPPKSENPDGVPGSDTDESTNDTIQASDAPEGPSDASTKEPENEPPREELEIYQGYQRAQDLEEAGKPTDETGWNRSPYDREWRYSSPEQRQADIDRPVQATARAMDAPPAGEAAVPGYVKELYQSDPERDPGEIWIYRAEEVLASKIKGPMPGKQILKTLQSAGVKPEELKWTGLDEFLATDEKKTPAEVKEYIAANKLQIKELNTEENGKTKYDDYTIPGGERYREVLLTLPRTDIEEAPRKIKAGSEEAYASLLENEIEPLNRRIQRLHLTRDGDYETLASQRDELEERLYAMTEPDLSSTPFANRKNGPDYNSSHWSAPNVLAHTRLKDYTDIKNRKMLFVEEIQSDWHQAGRKKGYRTKTKEQIQAEIGMLGEMVSKEGRGYTDEELEKSKLLNDELIRNDSKVPDAPFKKNWHEFVFKRILREAAEEGYDVVGWTTGEQQAERYNLSKQVDELAWVPTGEDKPGYGRLVGHQRGTSVIDKYMDEASIQEYVGKEIANKLLTTPRVAGESQLRGNDLKVGGEGMKGFYDKMIVDFANKYGKKWGTEVETTKLETGDWSIVEAGTGISDGRIIKGDFQSQEDAEAYAESKNLSYYEVRKQDMEVHALPVTDEMRESVMQGQTLFQVAPPTDSPEFKAWFGDSKVVDAEGNPMVVYHGTDQVFDTFEMDKRRQINPAFSFSPKPRIASTYGSGGSVMPVYLKIERLAIIGGTGPDHFDRLDKVDRNKYDGAIYAKPLDYSVPAREWETRVSKVDEIVVFSPTQIKSVNNRGTWSNDDPRILFQGNTKKIESAIMDIAEDMQSEGIRYDIKGSRVSDSRYISINVNDKPYSIRVSDHQQGQNSIGRKRVEFQALVGENWRPAFRQWLGGLLGKELNTYEDKPREMKTLERGRTSLELFQIKDLSHGAISGFSTFDHSYMGTGEGQQVYGWGTYLTENRDVARDNYAKRLGKEFTLNFISPNGYDDNFSDSTKDPGYRRIFESLKKEVTKAGSSLRLDDSVAIREILEQSINAAIEAAEYEADTTGKDHTVDVKNAAGMIRKMIDWDKPLSIRKGRWLYTVDVETNGDKIPANKLLKAAGITDIYQAEEGTGDAIYRGRWIQWNKPIRDEDWEDVYHKVKEIQKEIEKNGPGLFDPITIREVEEYSEIFKEYENDQIESIVEELKIYLLMFEDWEEINGIKPDGQDLYNAIMSVFGEGDTRNEIIAKRAASLLLKAAGFDGITYPVAFLTGGTGDKGMNYVVFDDKAIKIKRRVLFQGEGENAEADAAKAHQFSGIDDPSLAAIKDEARTFGTWEEFASYVETFFNEEIERITAADKIDESEKMRFYREIWEAANQKENFGNDMKSWAASLEKNEYQGLKEFLEGIWDEILSEETYNYQPDDLEDADRIKKSMERATRVSGEIAEVVKAGAIRIGAKGKDLSPKFMASVMGIINKNPEAYARIYGEIFEIPDLVTAAKTAEATKYADIEDPSFKESRLTTSQKAAIAEVLRNEDVGRKIMTGDIVVGDEVKRYMDSLKAEGKEQRKKIGELQEEIKQDNKILGAWDKRWISASKRITQADNELEKIDARIEKLRTSNKRIPKSLLDEQNALKRIRDTMVAQQARARRKVGNPARLQTTLAKVEESARMKMAAKDRELKKRAAQRLREHIKQLTRQIMQKPSDKVNASHAMAILDIQKMIDPHTRSSSTQATIESLRKELEKNPALSREIGREWVNRASKKNISEFTLAELEELASKVKALRNEGRAVFATKEEARKDYAYHTQERIADILLHLPGAAVPGDQPDKDSFFGKLVGKIRDFDYAFTKSQQFARMMDGAENGPNYDLLIMERDRAYRKEMVEVERRMKKIQEAFVREGVKAEDWYKTELVLKGIGPGRTDRTLRKSDVLALELALRNEDSRQAVIFGNFFSHYEKRKMNEEELYFEATDRFNVLRAAMDSVITEQDLRILETFAADGDETGRRLFETVAEVENRVMEVVENYFPINREGVTGDPIDVQIAGDVLNRTPGTKRPPKNGFTKSRVNISPKNQTPIKLDLLTTWSKSILAQEHYIANAELGRRMNDIYLNNFMQEQVRAAMGDQGLAYLKDYIAEVKNPGSLRNISRWENSVKWLRGNLGAAYLGFRASSVLKQLITSPWPAMAYAGPPRFLAETFKSMANPVKYVRDAEAYSAVLRNRTADLVLEAVKTATAKTEAGRKVLKTQQVALKGLELADRFSVAIGWRAVFEKEMAEHGNMDAAIEKADDMVLKTQPSSRGVDLAPIYRNGGEAMKMLLQFTVPMNVIWNNIRHDIPAALQDKHYFRAIGIVTSYIISGMLLSLATEGEDDDDENKRAALLAFYAFTQGTESIPLIGSDVTRLVRTAITGESGYDFPDTALPGATQVLDGLTTIAKDPDNWERGLEQFSSGVGLTIGVPVSTFKEIRRVAGGDFGALLGKPRKRE